MIQRDVFCVHKPGFLMLGHNLASRKTDCTALKLRIRSYTLMCKMS